MARTDESALIALSLEYADAVRSQDAERWAATWTDDARWILGVGRDVVGREAIVEMWASVDRQVRHRRPAVPGHQSFDVDGDTATGRCQFQEFNVGSTAAAHDPRRSLQRHVSAHA